MAKKLQTVSESEILADLRVKARKLVSLLDFNEVGLSEWWALLLDATRDVEHAARRLLERVEDE